MSGISEQMKESEMSERNGVMALLEWQPCVAQPLGRWCKLWGVSTSPCNHETGICLALIDRFLATTSVFSNSAQTRSCYTTAKSTRAPGKGTGQMHLCDKHIWLCKGRASRAIVGLIMIHRGKKEFKWHTNQTDRICLWPINTGKHMVSKENGLGLC